MADPDLASLAEASGQTTRVDSRRILVVAPAWIGDMVMAQSLFKALDRVPGTAIDVVAPSSVFPLLAHMPEVRHAVPVPLVHGRLQLSVRYRLARSLSKSDYDQAVVLPNSWKSALVPYLARIPRRTGYIGEHRWVLLNDARKLDPKVLPMTVQRFVALAGDAADPVEPDDFEPPVLSVGADARARIVDELGIAGAGRVLILCPGAEYGPSKRWPVKYYASLARSKLKDGWRVLVLGSGKDAADAHEINRGCEGKCIDLTGKTTLGQAVTVLSLASAVVSNDSGLMHVAAALRIPQVALFGSSDPAHTPPLNENSRTLYLGLSCSPCFERRCPLQHHNCLNQITPERVLEAIDSITREGS